MLRNDEVHKMKSLELRLQVTSEGELVLPSVPELEPGEYNVVLVIENSTVSANRPPLDLPVADLGPWPEDLSLRREDLYGDEH
jgi:hypothetical protein